MNSQHNRMLFGSMGPKSIHLSNEFTVFSEGDSGIAIYLLNLMEYLLFRERENAFNLAMNSKHNWMLFGPMVPKSIHLSNEFTVFSMVRNHVLVCWHAGRSISGSAVRPIGPMVPKSIHLSNEFKVFSMVRSVCWCVGMPVGPFLRRPSGPSGPWCRKACI